MLKSFAGGRVFGGVWGSAVPTVLALHGWQRTHLDFASVFDAPAGEAVPAALAVDLFGFGATPPPPEAWGTDEYADHLVPLFDEAGTLGDRVVVVGHSFGGRVALRLCALVPDRIERLVLTGVPLLDRAGRRPRPPAPYRMVRWLHRMGLVGDRRLAAMQERYGSGDYRAAHGVMRGVLVRALAERYGERMAAVSCPVDLVWGEEDTEVPLEVARRSLPLFAAASLTVLPGVGHLTPTEAPLALRRTIVEPAARRPDGPGRVAGGPPGQGS